MDIFEELVKLILSDQGRPSLDEPSIHLDIATSVSWFLNTVLVKVWTENLFRTIFLIKSLTVQSDYLKFSSLVPNQLPFDPRHDSRNFYLSFTSILTSFIRPFSCFPVCFISLAFKVFIFLCTFGIWDSKSKFLFVNSRYFNLSCFSILHNVCYFWTWDSLKSKYLLVHI